jgi:hypothetical protein
MGLDTLPNVTHRHMMQGAVRLYLGGVQYSSSSARVDMLRFSYCYCEEHTAQLRNGAMCGEGRMCGLPRCRELSQCASC